MLLGGWVGWWVGGRTKAAAMELLKTESYLRDCIGLFTQDWLVVKRRFPRLLDLNRLLSSGALANLPSQTFVSFDPPLPLLSLHDGALPVCSCARLS